MMFKEIIEEGNSPEEKAAKIWLKISDLFVDLEDELLDASKTNPLAKEAIQRLRNDDLRGLSPVIKQMFWNRQR